MHSRLAVKNLIGAGLRTWLNISALALCFIVILFMQSMYTGIFNKIEHDMVETEVAGGQYWFEDYDPYDPIHLNDSHGEYGKFREEIVSGEVVPILMRTAVLYTGDGSVNIVLKGIPREQTLLSLPANTLNSDGSEILPLMVGSMMADRSGLQEGDEVTLSLRTSQGVHDAFTARIVTIFRTPIQSVDVGQLWMDLEDMQTLTGLDGRATLVTVSAPLKKDIPHWEYQGMDVMFADINSWKVQELGGAYMMAAILLGLAVLAVFDTQLLAIFHRKKEIGTLVSLGMTQQSVVWLFTVEGFYYGLLSVALGSIPGVPLMLYLSRNGIVIGEMSQSLSLNFDSVVYPLFNAGIFITSALAVLTVVLLVSFLACRRIAKMNIVKVLKGK